MKKIVFLLHALVVFACCFSQHLPGTYYLTHIRIVDVINGNVLPDMTVAITDSNISVIGTAREIRIPAGAKVINCNGKFILPGLWDMHVHLGNATSSALPLFIANGITGVRDMGSKRFDSIQKWKKADQHWRGCRPPDYCFGTNFEWRA